MAGVNGEGHLYNVSDLLGVRLECLKAQAYAMKNSEKLLAWYEQVKASDFDKLDYCELIA